MQRIVKKLFKESSIYSLQPIFEKMVAFLLLPIYTAYLSPADYGNLQYIITVGLFLIPFMSGGLETSFWKFRTESSGYSKGEVILNILFTQGVLSLSVVLIVYVLSGYVFEDMIAPLVVIYVVAVATSLVYKSSLLILRANHRAGFYIVATVCYAVFLALSNIYFIVYLKMNFKGVIYGNLTTSILFSVAFCYLLVKECGGSLKFGLSHEMLKYSIPIALGNIASIVISLSDRFFLKALSSDLELGLYSFGCQFGNLVMIFLITPFFLGWNPMRWEIYEMENAKEIFSKIYEIMLVLLPFAALVLTSAGIMLGMFMTSDKEFLGGFSIVIIIAFSHVFFGLYYFNAMGMLFSGKTKLITSAVTVSAILNLVLNYVLIPGFGMVGASIATLFSYFVMFFMSRHYCQKYYYIKRNLLLEVMQVMGILGSSAFALTVYQQNILSLFEFALMVFCLSLIMLICSFMTVSFKVKDVLRLWK